MNKRDLSDAHIHLRNHWTEATNRQAAGLERFVAKVATDWRLWDETGRYIYPDVSLSNICAWLMDGAERCAYDR